MAGVNLLVNSKNSCIFHHRPFTFHQNVRKVKRFKIQMAYRKFNADFLFTGYEMLNGNDVLVTDDSGIVIEIIPLKEAGGNVEKLEGILSPGFVNCHCHLELSHMKGLIPEKTGLVDFLLSVIKQRNYPADVIQQSIADGENALIENGVVAVGDICNTTDTIQQKKQGNLYYHNFIETIGFTESVAEERFGSSHEIFKKFAQYYDLPVESNSIVPHAPYSVSNKLFELIANFPGNHLLTIHNQESEEENNFFETGDGNLRRLYQSLGIDISFFRPTKKRSPENYLHYFHKNQSLILVHNVATSEEDLDVFNNRRLAFGSGYHQTQNGSQKLQAANLFFCLCPNANQYISGIMPNIDLLIKQDCMIVVGTDSLASNHQLYILEELKTIQQHFPLIETKTLLQWATINGAYALQLSNMVGSLEKGKQPGIVLIENCEGGKLTAQSRAKRII
jgi:cytosine/adenosine deaminase-related metal-dependent hydrolase